MEAAAELAADLQAKLADVLIDDARLLATAKLPFMRTVGSFFTNLHELDGQRLEWGLRADAGRAQRALEMAAGKAQVRVPSM